jgi:hypothetical protein
MSILHGLSQEPMNVLNVSSGRPPSPFEIQAPRPVRKFGALFLNDSSQDPTSGRDTPECSDTRNVQVQFLNFHQGPTPGGSESSTIESRDNCTCKFSDSDKGSLSSTRATCGTCSDYDAEVCSDSDKGSMSSTRATCGTCSDYDAEVCSDSDKGSMSSTRATCRTPSDSDAEICSDSDKGEQH